MISKKATIITVIVVVILALLFIFKSLFIVAIVNGRPIYRFSVLKELEKQGGKQTLNTIITKTIILQEGKKRKIVINQKDIDAEVQKVEVNVANQGLTLDAALEQAGMKKSDLINEIKVQLIAQKLAGEIKVTEKEIEDYITTQKTQLTKGAQEITKDEATQALKQQKLQQKIQEIVSELKNKAKIIYFLNY